MTDGFLAPVFFVWLGPSLDLRSLVEQPRMIALVSVGIAGFAAVRNGGDGEQGRQAAPQDLRA
ncbi:MAG TPA: hypothetical protein VH333_05685 [Pseudonocardiaceae bacterium]|nr:hypothetical protein [Pseudonocardiaceae bacterium]